MSTTDAPAGDMETLRAILAHADYEGLPGPRDISMQRGDTYDILAITLRADSDAIAWCESFGGSWRRTQRGTFYNIAPIHWQGWRVSLHVYCEPIPDRSERVAS